MNALTSRHLIDPEILPALDFFSSLDGISVEALPGIRQNLAQLIAQLPAVDMPSVEVEKRLVPGLEGAPAFRW